MFSVVIPLYNKENFIRETVKSVLDQDFKEFEVIVVNDGSTDNSVSKLEDLSDDRLKVVNQKNLGVGPARNTGMSLASFEWIALIDSDDLWAPNHLSELKSIIEKFPESGMVSTNYISFYTDSNTQVQNSNLKSNIRLINYLLEPIVHTSAVAINKHAFNKIGGFTTHKNGEDIEYWVRMSLNYPIAISDRTTSFYRRDTGGITDSAKLNMKKDYFKAHKSLSEISPSLEYLENSAKEDSSILKKSDVIAYINNNLLQGTKMWLYRDNLPMAKQMTKFAIPTLSKSYYIMFSVKTLPEPVMKVAIKNYKKVKNIIKSDS